MNTQAMNLSANAPQNTANTIHHHPGENLLVEYASGSLNPGTAIAVSAHLAFCEECRHKVRNFEAIGALMVENLEPAEVDNSSFDALMAKIDQQAPAETPTAAATNVTLIHKGKNKELPGVVKRLIKSHQTPLKWTKLGWTLKTAKLPNQDQEHELSLHRIKAGGKILEHDHFGDEYTLVLKGSFSDEDGLYQQGDFIHKQPGDTHRPLAAKHEDCLCLVVQQEPVKFTGWLTRWLNPLLKRK